VSERRQQILVNRPVPAALPRPVTTLLRSPIGAVWACLVSFTLASWALGVETAFGSHGAASTAILILAFFKVRLVALYFMELRGAPRVLRVSIEAYCVLVCAVVLSFYYAG